MADYAKWEEKKLPVTSLYLDPLNPRIPPADKQRDQRDLIAELVEHESVLDLMRDIAETGYAPIESLVGLHEEEDKRTYILEGNRRLAALKLLLSPDASPDSARKRVQKLSKEANHDSLKKVRVLIAPSREAAAPLLMQKHTRTQVEKWSPAMKARFYRNLADAGTTPAELARRYGGTAGEVAEFLRSS